MKDVKYIQILIAVLMLVTLEACGNKKQPTTNISETAVVSDLVAHSVDDSRMATTETVDSTYYYYDYRNSYEYSVIELISEADKVLNGYFWGTTDEFMDVREGYLPGFMVLPMEDIEQRGDTLNFVLDSNGHKFYSAPVSIYIHDPAKEHCDTLHAWLQNDDQWWDRVKYIAVFSKNKKELTIVGKSKFEYFRNEPHIFMEYSKDSLEKILPRMPGETEKENRRPPQLDSE